VRDVPEELRIRVGPRAAKLVAWMAHTGRTPENTGDRLPDIVDMDGLQPRLTHAEQWKDRQGPEEMRERREELVVGCEHDRRPHDGGAGEALMDDRLAFTTGADVVRGRCRICTDAGDVDEALHAGLAGEPSDARRRLNMDSMEGLAAPAFDVEADGVYDPV